MYKYAEKFWRFLLETDFQLGGNIVYTRERKFVGHGAVTGNIKTPADPFDFDIVHVEHLRKFIYDLS
jgi:hypothetical protein